MKRILTAAAAAGLLLTGCGGTANAKCTSENITYLPSEAAMQEAMNALGYQTSQFGDFEKDGYTIFSASNGKDIEEFEGVMVMRTKNTEDFESRKQTNQGISTDHTVIYIKTDDPSLGNVLVTGTEKGISDAGIKHD